MNILYFILIFKQYFLNVLLYRNYYKIKYFYFSKKILINPLIVNKNK